MKDCRLTTISDIHWGGRTNDTVLILNNGERMLIKDGLIAKSDILFFAGDEFDRKLEFDHENVGDIELWIAAVLREAKLRGTKVRIVRGTGSHDHDQAERFMTIAQVMEIDVDIKYFNKLDIEYIEDFDCHVLYVPDHWTPTTEETLQQVKDLLKARGLEAVDIAVMHGHMDFQVPKEIKTIPMHDSAEYERLVRHFITIGHVHTHSRQGKIFAQGSFDRLKHGEEEPKGLGYCEIIDNKMTAWFIENKGACIYKTVDCEGLELDDALKHIKSRVKNLPPGSRVRVVAESKHPLFSNMSELSIMFPLFVWSKKGKEEDDEFVHKETGQLLDDGSPEWVPVQIERSNIVDLVMNRLKAKAFSELDLEYMRAQLEELK